MTLLLLRWANLAVYSTSAVLAANLTYRAWREYRGSPRSLRGTAATLVSLFVTLLALSLLGATTYISTLVFSTSMLELYNAGNLISGVGILLCMVGFLRLHGGNRGSR